MADFVHCNACYALPGPKSKFFLTACGHLLCERCKERAADQCCVCKKKCNIVEVGRGLNPTMQSLFTDPVALSKKYHRELTQTLGFQKMQRARYVSCLQQQLKKAKKLQEFAVSETKKRQHTEKENQKLTEEIAQIKQQMTQMTTRMTPNPNPPNRHRPNARANDTYNGLPMRNPVMNDTGMSLPAPAMGYGQNFFGLGGSPYTESLQTSPSRFQFPEDSTVAGSPSTMMNGRDMTYGQAWMNNSPAMMRNPNILPAPVQQQQEQQHQHGGYQRMNGVANAFRGV